MFSSQYSAVVLHVISLLMLLNACAVKQILNSRASLIPCRSLVEKQQVQCVYIGFVVACINRFFFFNFLIQFCLFCRAEASRLAEENIVLRQKIAALKDEDLKEEQLM